MKRNKTKNTTLEITFFISIMIKPQGITFVIGLLRQYKKIFFVYKCYPGRPTYKSRRTKSIVETINTNARATALKSKSIFIKPKSNI